MDDRGPVGVLRNAYETFHAQKIAAAILRERRKEERDCDRMQWGITHEGKARNAAAVVMIAIGDRRNCD